MNTPPKVTITIPVYNTAKYLPKCLDSVLNQTLKDIEIVIVNDASPDNAAELLAEYAAKDSRVKVVTHEKNGGILAARSSGIRAATGEFVLFLDADDFLNRDIARAAYRKAKKTGADVIHFQTHVITEAGKINGEARETHRKMNPYPHTLKGEEVLAGAFKGLFRWNNVGKMVSIEVARKAADDLLPGYYIMGEDFCFCTHMMLHAKHYEPLMRTGYNYILNVGVSAYSILDRNGFQRKCSIFTALNAVRSLLQRHNVWEKYRSAFEKHENDLIGDMGSRWINGVLATDKQYCAQYMLEHYGVNELLRGLANFFTSDSDAQCFIMHLPKNFLPMECNPLETPKHIGIYVDDATTDMAQQLLRLPPVLQERGIQAEVIAPETLGAPSLAGADASGRAKRVQKWHEIITERQFDCILYVEPEETRIYWDVLAIRTAGARLMFVPRTNFQCAGSMRTAAYVARMRTLQYANLILCLSEKEQAHYREMGIRTALLPVEPMDIPSANSASAPKDVVWLGNDGNTASLTLAAMTFAKLMPDLPQDAILHICSPEVPNEVKRKFFDHTNALKMTGRYEFHDATHMAAILPLAEIFLIEGGDTELANHAAMFRNARAIVCADTPEETIERIRKGNTEAVTRQATWDNVFQIWAVPVEKVDNSDLNDSLLQLFNSAMCHERYSIEPPVCGDTFHSLYRDFDKGLSKVLKPGTKIRNYVFKGVRKMKKIFK